MRGVEAKEGLIQVKAKLHPFWEAIENKRIQLVSAKIPQLLESKDTHTQMKVLNALIAVEIEPIIIPNACSLMDIRVELDRLEPDNEVQKDKKLSKKESGAMTSKYSDKNRTAFAILDDIHESSPAGLFLLPRLMRGALHLQQGNFEKASEDFRALYAEKDAVLTPEVRAMYDKHPTLWQQCVQPILDNKPFDALKASKPSVGSAMLYVYALHGVDQVLSAFGQGERAKAVVAHEQEAVGLYFDNTAKAMSILPLGEQQDLIGKDDCKCLEQMPGHIVPKKASKEFVQTAKGMEAIADERIKASQPEPKQKGSWLRRKSSTSSEESGAKPASPRSSSQSMEYEGRRKKGVPASKSASDLVELAVSIPQSPTPKKGGSSFFRRKASAETPKTIEASGDGTLVQLQPSQKWDSRSFSALSSRSSTPNISPNGSDGGTPSLSRPSSQETSPRKNSDEPVVNRRLAPQRIGRSGSVERRSAQDVVGDILARPPGSLATSSRGSASDEKGSQGGSRGK